MHTSQVAHQAGAYLGFSNVKRLGISLLPPGWDASPSQGYLNIKFVGTHLYAWVELERGTVRIKKCLSQEHNTISPARARTRTARSSIERTNHEATALTKKSEINIMLERDSIRYQYMTLISQAMGSNPLFS